MTDDEIITALECCSHRGKKDCDNCPVNYKTAELCFEDVMSDAFDLINRQKAEIERYLHSIKILENDVQTAKSETIKEFAERLKYRADKTRIKNMETEKVVYYMDEFKLDKLIKEMTEVQENDG